MAVIKQYINLKTDSPKADDIEEARRGRKITVQAKLDKKVEGVEVFWTIEPDSENYKFEPSNNSKNGGFSPGRYKLKNFTDIDGASSVEFNLSTYAGDKFTISASLNDKSAEKILEETFEVWKRLWYQVSYLKKYKSTNFTISEKSYKENFIELKLSEKIEFAKPDNKKAAIGNFNFKKYKKIYKGTKKPYEAHVILVDEQYDRYSQTDTYRSSTTSGIFKCELEDNETIWNLDSKPWFVSGNWNLTAADGTTRNGSISKANVKKKTAKKISFNLKTSVGKMKAGDKLDLSIKYLYSSGPFAGDGTYPPHNLIAMKGNGNSFINDTVVHEIGHGIGMVDSAVSTHYELDGDHCHEGATKVDTDWVGGKCVMFENGVNDGKSLFCEKCKPFVDMSEVNEATLWK